jgi:tetratricopeptide (TPR) repeat protein
MNSMGDALWSLFRNQKAKGLRAAMRQTLRKMERAGLTDSAWFNAMGELALEEHNATLALRFFQQACTKSEVGEHWLNQGHALYALGDYPEAEKIYGGVLARFPEDVHALVNRANCLVRMERLEDAWMLCENGLSRTQARPALWNAQGQIAFLREDYSQALDLFRKAYREAPDYIDTLFNQANVEARLGRREEAIEHFEMCTRKDENYESAFHNQALLLFEIGRLKEAQKVIQKAMLLKPESAENMSLLAQIHFRAGDLKLAREVFRKALRIQEEHLPSLIGLARLVAQESQEDEALALVKRILNLPSLGIEDRKTTLSLLLDLSQFHLALLHCERASETDQEKLGLIHTVALWKTGKLREAIARMEKVLEQEGESSSALILLGMMLREQGAPQLAEPRLKRALELDEGDPRAASELALILLNLKRPLEAVQCLEEAIESHYGHADLLYNLACAQTRAGNRDDALTSLKMALENGFSDWDRLGRDPDMENLRHLHAFNALIGDSGPVASVLVKS